MCVIRFTQSEQEGKERPLPLPLSLQEGNKKSQPHPSLQERLQIGFQVPLAFKERLEAWIQGLKTRLQARKIAKYVSTLDLCTLPRFSVQRRFDG